jgi:uncharacterized protein involved in response to NO
MPWQNLLAQPHRLFFFWGIMQGMALIALLGTSYAGWASLHVSPDFFHGYGMSFVVFTQFFVGFLLTTFPRYLARPSVQPLAYLWAALLLNVGGGVLILSALVSEMFLGVALLLVLAGYVKLTHVLWVMQRASSVANKRDTSWLLGAFGVGALGQLLFIAALFGVEARLGVLVSFYGYLFMVVMIVSQKMIPFFAANKISGYVVRKSPYFLPSLAVMLGAKVGLESTGASSLVADALIAGILLSELIRWKLPFRQSPPMLWVLFLSIWWAPVGFLLFTLEGLARAFEWPLYLGHAPLHALALGYFTTILIGFGTRVLLGHSGRQPIADKYSTMLFGLIQLMTLMRVSADVVGGLGYLHLVVTSAVLWGVVFGWWAGRFGKILFEK